MDEMLKISMGEIKEILRVITNVYDNAQKGKFDFTERDAKYIMQRCNYILDAYTSFKQSTKQDYLRLDAEPSRSGRGHSFVSVLFIIVIGVILMI